MLCFQCGTKVGGDASKCTNCGVALKTEKKLELSTSRGLRISQEMKAIRIDQQIFPPGERIDDRYQLGEMIGKGPFGEVYRAFDEVISSDIAIKLFKKELIKNPPDQDAFLRGMESARKETHENIVRIHASGVHKDHPWVASQLLEGLSLRKVISLRIKKNEKFETHELDAVLSQIQTAIETKTSHLHGDLKPENIVFLPDTLKVTDGFIAEVFSAKGFKKALKDSPYLAPEYSNLKAEKNEAVDVYSVGVIVNEMLLGSDYKKGKILPTRVSSAVDEIIKKATNKEPAKRYATLAELRNAFNATTGAASVVPPPPPVDSAGASQEMVNVSSDDLPIIEAETVEYNRKVDREIENYILTTEVQRTKSDERSDGPPPPVAPKAAPVLGSASQSGLLVDPKIKAPAVPAGKAKASSEERGFPFLWIGLAIAILGIVFFVTQSDKPIDLGKPSVAKLEKEEPKVEEKKVPVEIKVPENTVEKPIAQTIAPVENTIEKPVENKTTAALVDEKPVDEKSIPGMLKDAKSELVDGKTVEPKTEKDPKDSKNTIALNDPKVEEVEVPPGTKCPKGLKLKKRKWGNYCIARYEYPGAGAKPKTRVSWFAAKKMCEARDQRLCKRKEWRSACGSKYPYGNTFDANKCNSVDEDGFDRSVARAGSFRGCKKGGVYDLVGNVHEWTQEQKIVGGGFESDESVASCRYSSSKSPGSSAGYIGFRCCADPE